MFKRHLPSIEALTSNDDQLQAEELRLSQLSAKLAFARACLDQVERMLGYRAREQPANDAEERQSAAARALG